MWKVSNDCGCNNVSTRPFEFQISENSLINHKQYPDLIQIPYEDRLCELKEKAICNYTDILDQLDCGIQPDLEFLLEEISLIDIESYRNSIARFEIKHTQHFVKKKTSYPHIDEETGNWFVGDLDTGIHAQGPEGLAPTISEETGNWIIGGEDSGIRATPIIPHIDEESGNWFIANEDTGVYSAGGEYTFTVSPTIFKIDGFGNLIDNYGNRISKALLELNAYRLINGQIDNTFVGKIKQEAMYKDEDIIITETDYFDLNTKYLSIPYSTSNGTLIQVIISLLNNDDKLIDKITVSFVKDGLDADVSLLAFTKEELDELLI